MLAGIGPVLGEGIAGYFIDSYGWASAWEYRPGAVWSGGQLMQGLPLPYQLRRNPQKLAVLIDSRVGSAGEAIALSFRARAGTRFFGTATCGVSTGLREYILSDGATLDLATSVMTDRHQVGDGGAVEPDVVISDQGAVVQQAVSWILSDG